MGWFAVTALLKRPSMFAPTQVIFNDDDKDHDDNDDNADDYDNAYNDDNDYGYDYAQ